jgi:type II secretory pathway component GspD/PulD (secretin)
VRHGAAKELAATLAKHFKDDAEVQVLPDAPSNCLLINARPEVLPEVVKVLDQLDRRPRAIEVEVVVAEVAEKKAEDGKPEAPAKGLDEAELTGPARDVWAKVEALQRKGQLGAVRRLQLAAVEGQAASALVGENKPFVTGMMVAATGRTSRAITYRNTGTQVRVTPTVTAEKVVQLDFDFSDARLHVPEDGVPIGTDEKGQTVRAAETVNATLKTKLSVPAGQAVFAKGVQTTSKSGKSQTLVLVSARVVEPDPRANQ